MMANPRCGLLLDPGLGKTSATLAAFDMLKRSRHVKHALVCAPLRVAKTVWPVESQKWSDFRHLKVVDLCEKTKKERIELLKLKADIYVINPESLIRVLELDPWKWVEFDMLVIDESTKFKDSSTQRFRALKPHLIKFPRRHILTGTPAPNGLEDLFGQMYIVDQGETLGKYITHFRMRYMYKGPNGFTWILAKGMEQHIYDKVKPYLLRLMAKDHLEMPDLIPNVIEVTLPPAIMAKYKKLERHFLMELSDTTVAAFNSAAKGSKCRQVANGFIYDEDHVAHAVHTEKLDALAELVEELQGRPLLLCYEFIEDARAIADRFPNVVNISGVSNALTVVNDFNAGKIPLLMGNPRSMSHGLNLQEACKDICWFGLNWDLELTQQAIARIWRQGQTSPVVNNHVIVAKGTLDEEVAKRLESKDLVQSKFNDAIKILAAQVASEVK